MTLCKKEPVLCQEADGLPFEVIGNHTEHCPILVVCDHASAKVPLKLNGLGIDAAHLKQHIAYDIGAEKVSRALVEKLNATGVLSGFSRLVIDANRYLSALDSIPSVSDGIPIIANQHLSNIQIALRTEELFIPYHEAISQNIARIMINFRQPLIVSVHSFTPIFQNVKRPWDVGVLWEDEEDIAVLLVDFLRANTPFLIGENEPYQACDPNGYTIKTHAQSKGYPHCLVEIRQDLIADRPGQKQWASILCDAVIHLEQVLGRALGKR